MAKIKGIIPPQRFEIVRDRIGAILADEIYGQFLLGAIPKYPVVWIERSTPYDKTEVPAINISLDKGDYSNKHQGNVDGAYSYNIDVVTSSPETDNGTSDKLAMLKLQRIVGVVRYILENPIYRTLDYPAPFNCGTMLESFTIDDVQKGDAVSHARARLYFRVTIPETVDLLDGLPLAMSLTDVRLELTEEGYKYQVGRNRRYISQIGEYFTTGAGEFLTPNINN